MKDKHVSIPMTILSLAIGIIVIFPIIWLVLSSFKPSGELFTYPLHMFPSTPTTEHYKSVLDGGFMGYVKNSLFLAVVGTLITLLISAMCGYALAIYRFEIKYVNLVFGVFLLGTLIPGETLTVPQFSVISAMGLYNNIWGVILPVVTTTTGIFMYRQHYMSLPLSLVEAARIDGASEWKIFSNIMLPLGSNVTITLTIFSFMWRWNDYILPLLVCFPFLLFPAWLSIRIAMRPWNKVVNEITLRTPDDLSPLRAVPKHRELRQMVDAINDFLARVRESAERERVFIADAAHELRTPLAAMRINVEALQSWVISESQQELLAGVIRSNSRAARLVNQLLLMMHSEARIDTAMESVPLTTLIQERMAELEPLASARKIELEFFAEDDVWIHGVRERLVSLIDNLIENAVKYSPEGGRIEVQLQSRDKCAQLRVSDAGPGIPIELRERVFDRFFRDPNQTQSGSGLGLAIVKAVTQQHNGRVNLSTSAEGGLMVTVDFPNPAFA